MGYGSSASKHVEDINKTLKSCEPEDSGEKGMMLAHPFYRSFLLHIIYAYDTHSNEETGDSDEETGSSTSNSTESSNMAFFVKQYANIWKQTEFGLVSTSNKNTNG